MPNPPHPEGARDVSEPGETPGRGTESIPSFILWAAGREPAPEPPARATAAKGGRKTGNTGHGWGKAKGTYAPPPARAPQSPWLLSVPSRKTAGREGGPGASQRPGQCQPPAPGLSRCSCPVMPQPCPGCPRPEDSGTATPATHPGAKAIGNSGWWHPGEPHRQEGTGKGQKGDTVPLPGLGPV